MVVRSAILGCFLAGTWACASAETGPESVEEVIADLIEDTKDLRSYRAVYEVDDPTARLEVQYEHPNRARVSGPAGEDGSHVDYWLVDAVAHMRGAAEFGDFDFNPLFISIADLDRMTFQVIKRPEPSLEVDIVRGIAVVKISTGDGSHRNARLPWLHSMEHETENCRLDGEEIVYSVGTGEQAYVSLRSGFPTRIRTNKGRWLVLRELEMNVELGDAVFAVPEPMENARDVSEESMFEASTEVLHFYRWMYQALEKDPDRWDGATLEQNWRLFHEQGIRNRFESWVAKSNRNMDQVESWLRSLPETIDRTSSIAERESLLFGYIEKARESYLDSVRQNEGDPGSEAMSRAHAIEREAAEGAFESVVEEPLRRRWDEVLAAHGA